MNQTEIFGTCPPQFEPVREAFAANFAEGLEQGARFALALEGEVVVDLWAGTADRAKTRPFDETTLTPVFSTTKAVAALMMARLVSQGHHQGGDGLGGGEYRRQGVGTEGAGAIAVGPAGHQVDDHLAADRRGESRAQLPALGEIGQEGVPDRREALGADAVDLDRLGHR